MNWPAVLNMEQEQGIEYSVYSHDQPKGGQKGPTSWEKQDAFSDMAEALKKAESLFDTGQYSKVEVKQKYFDKKKNRNVDTVLRVYEGKKKKSHGTIYILLFAVLCGIIAFAVTYYLVT